MTHEHATSHGKARPHVGSCVDQITHGNHVWFSNHMWTRVSNHVPTIFDHTWSCMRSSSVNPWCCQETPTRDPSLLWTSLVNKHVSCYTRCTYKTSAWQETPLMRDTKLQSTLSRDPKTSSETQKCMSRDPCLPLLRGHLVTRVWIVETHSSGYTCPSVSDNRVSWVYLPECLGIQTRLELKLCH